MATKYVVAGVVTGIGLVVLVVGCVLIPVFDMVVDDTIIEATRYENGSDGYDNFVNPSSPTYTKFYFFNLTNPNEVLLGTEIPHVEEVGPYVYRTEKPKHSLLYLDYKTKIRYRTTPVYYFEPDLSTGDPYQDNITTVNLIILAAAYTLEMNPDIAILFGRNFRITTEDNNEEVFESFSINDLLWGYTDPTMLATSLPPGYATNGLFYEVNETVTDNVEVYTGIDEIDRVNEISTWKGVRYASSDGVTPIWNSPTANMLNGTDGTQYKPFIEKDDLLYTFSIDVCRGFKMLYDSEQDVRGINTYRFVIDPANFNVVPENEGFCFPTADDCLPEGLLNVETCYDGVPLAASLPHYYEAEPAVQATISGLNPQKELHETAIDIEPTTGISVQGNKRLQINFRIQNYTYFTASQVAVLGAGLILPVFWLNEFTEISQPDANDFISEVIEPIELLEIVQYVVIGVGAFVMLVGLILLAYFRCTRNRKNWA